MAYRSTSSIGYTRRRTVGSATGDSYLGITLPLSKGQRQKRNRAAKKAAAENRDVSEPKQGERRGAKRAKAVEFAADPASEVIYYEG